MNKTIPTPVPAVPFRVLEPVPPEPSLELVTSAPEPMMVSYRCGKTIVLEHGAPVPTDMCIKSGRPAYRTREISLRNPFNPRTWFGRRPVLEVGLSLKHNENHSVAVALTWSVLAVGAMVTTVGILTMSILSMIVGLLALGISGFFRATSPVTSPDATDDHATIMGACELFLKQFPDRTERE